jgi:hypothetical protein
MYLLSKHNGLVPRIASARKLSVKKGGGQHQWEGRGGRKRYKEDEYCANNLYICM